MGSRAMSHDSIFLPDQDLSSPEQPRVLSQENIQGRIKELQVSLHSMENPGSRNLHMHLKT
uniref:Uncharacterized protein n=1 Tax=Oncorhynchus tshawytscha TaxID=74940 RepID=A0A8C8CX90_ONCTS